MIRNVASFSFAIAIALLTASARAQIILGGEMQAGLTHFEIEGGHILFQAMLNGRGPYAFYFDTGATNVLTPEVAAELNLDAKGGGYAAGFGKAHPATRQAHVASLTLGDFSLSDQVFNVLELPNVVIDRGSRPKLAGLIGGDFLALFVAHIDFDKRSVSFMPAGGFSHSGDGLPVDLSLSLTPIQEGRIRERPFLTATIDGTPATLLLDTGSGGVATIFPNTDIARALYAKSADHLHILAPGGVGGTVSYDLMRIASLQVGSITDVAGGTVIGVMTDGLGYAPRKSEVGVLGLGALGRFNLTIDYPHSAIYLERRSHAFGQTAKYGFRGSGLELTKDDHGRFGVLGVIAGSPAETAGIAAGDEIFAVDGRPAADMALFDYMAADRTDAPISIVTGPEGHRRTTVLKKAVLLP